MKRNALGALWLALAGTACSPTLDWRELRPPGSGVAILMPCSPAVFQRTLPLAGQTQTWTLHACEAGGPSWSLGFADVTDPQRVGPVLRALRAAGAAGLLDGTVQEALPPSAPVPGATPQPDGVRVHLSGRTSDGRQVQMRMQLFSVGTRVFRAMAVGERVQDESVETFLGSLRVLP